jgi:serine/threonine protein phosphatase PrpC
LNFLVVNDLLMDRPIPPVFAHGILSLGDENDRLMVVCGASSIKGRRPQQEDMLMIHVDSLCAPIVCSGEASVSKGNHKGLSLVGVFDGHGGKRCSRFASQHMPENFHAALSELGSSKGFQASDFATAFRIAYRMTHEDFARLARGSSEADRPRTRQRLQDALQKARTHAIDGADKEVTDKLHSTFPQEELSLAALRSKMMQQRLAMGPRVWDDGSTALCCLIHGGKVFVANAGDSRAVACIAGRTIPLSVDHKPNLPAERARIHLAGGTVTSLCVPAITHLFTSP